MVSISFQVAVEDYMVVSHPSAIIRYFGLHRQMSQLTHGDGPCGPLPMGSAGTTLAVEAGILSIASRTDRVRV